MDNTDQIDHAEHEFWRNRCPECETNGGCEHMPAASGPVSPWNPRYFPGVFGTVWEATIKGEDYRVMDHDGWSEAYRLTANRTWNTLGRAANPKGAIAICESHSRGW